MITRQPSRSMLGATPLLISGAVLLIVGNIAHPLDADPTPTSRFEFATEPSWIPIHLALAVGFLLLTAGVVAVGRHLQHVRNASWAHFATMAAVVGGTMLVAVFGALDGYATSALAGSRASAEAIAAASIAEEAIDSGFAAMGTLAFFGLALGALGIAIVGDGRLRRWIGWSAIAIGAAGTLAGTMLLAEGPTSFTINVMLRPVAVAGTLWFITLGIVVRKLERATATRATAPEPTSTAAG